MKLKLPLVIVFLFSLCLNLSAQTTTKQPLPLVNYNQNVNAPLSASEMQKLTEVYGDNLDKEILSRPNRLKAIKNILRNRIEVIEISNKDLSRMKKLSEVPLFNIYNSKLKRDLVFNAQTFNPLKYDFNFFSRQGETVRIDNTNKIIRLKSQHQR